MNPAQEPAAHIAFNAWFWDRPETGSGQYLRHLVNTLRWLAPDLRLTLISQHQALTEVPPGAEVLARPPGRGGHLAKVRFEQQIVPRAAREVGAGLLHVPYWAGPLSSPLPVAVTIHDIIPLILPQYRGGLLARLYTGLVAASARGADAIITDSQASKTDIVQHLGVPAHHVEAIPLAAGPEYRMRGLNLVDAQVLKKYGLQEGYVLYLGGYDVRKNVRHLLKAFTYVREGTGEAHPLVLAGRLPAKRSPRFDDVPALIAQMNLGDVVRLIGHVEEGDKPSLYRMAGCVVYPSSYEGFGLPPLEAMACGAPLVAGDVPALRELTGEAAYLVQPTDARHLGGAILAVLLQEQLSSELRRKGPLRAAAYTWERTARQTVAIYGKAMSQAAPGR